MSIQRTGSRSTSGDRTVETGGAGDADAGAAAPYTLPEHRVAELRFRVLAGAYDAAHVVDRVAKRILERRHLRVWPRSKR